jgi:hypothetical protein
MAKKTPLPLPTFLIDVDDKTDEILRKSIAEFSGQVTVLESAIGALVIGQHYGTRVLLLTHGQATIKKYEAALGIKYTDHCPERGSLSEKSIGLKFADKLGGFWKVVTGKVKVEKKAWLDNE